jgi:hypothetical protein
MSSEPAMITGIGVLLLLTGALIGLLVFAFWVWMLVDAITNRGVTDTEKILFVLLVFFLPFIGSLIYFFVGRPKRRLAAT